MSLSVENEGQPYSVSLGRKRASSLSSSSSSSSSTPPGDIAQVSVPESIGGYNGDSPLTPERKLLLPLSPSPPREETITPAKLVIDMSAVLEVLEYLIDSGIGIIYAEPIIFALQTLKNKIVKGLTLVSNGVGINLHDEFQAITQIIVNTSDDIKKHHTVNNIEEVKIFNLYIEDCTSLVNTFDKEYTIVKNQIDDDDHVSHMFIRAEVDLGEGGGGGGKGGGGGEGGGGGGGRGGEGGGGGRWGTLTKNQQLRIEELNNAANAILDKKTIGNKRNDRSPTREEKELDEARDEADELEILEIFKQIDDIHKKKNGEGGGCEAKTSCNLPSATSTLDQTVYIANQPNENRGGVVKTMIAPEGRGAAAVVASPSLLRGSEQSARGVLAPVKLMTLFNNEQEHLSKADPKPAGRGSLVAVRQPPQQVLPPLVEVRQSPVAVRVPYPIPTVTLQFPGVISSAASDARARVPSSTGAASDARARVPPNPIAPSHTGSWFPSNSGSGFLPPINKGVGAKKAGRRPVKKSTHRKPRRHTRNYQSRNKHKRSSKSAKTTIKHRKSYRKHNRTIKRRKSRRHH